MLNVVRAMVLYLTNAGIVPSPSFYMILQVACILGLICALGNHNATSTFGDICHSQ